MIAGVAEDMASLVAAGRDVFVRRRCDAERIVEAARERGIEVTNPIRTEDGHWRVGTA